MLTLFSEYLYYLITPWCRVLLEKLTGLQLVKKFLAFLWNPKVHYRIHKRPPPVPVLGQPNPVHILTSHLLEIHPNIIHPSTPRSPQGSISLRFPHQDPIRPPLLTHTRHMSSPSIRCVQPYYSRRYILRFSWNKNLKTADDGRSRLLQNICNHSTHLCGTAPLKIQVVGPSQFPTFPIKLFSIKTMIIFLI